MKIANRYELGEKLGEGGMGSVYRAYDRLTKTEVALKSINVDPERLRFNSRSDNADLHLALANEFRTLASMRHPNIIEVLDYGFAEQPYFTMTLMPRAERITQVAAKVDFDEKLGLLVQLMQALHYLHRRGIVHRDLKPSNVLVSPDGTVRLLDFGIAMEQDSRQSVAGTIIYMSPEMFEGRDASFASDIFALGLITFELFAGIYPFPFNDTRKLLEHLMYQDPPYERVDAPDIVVRLLKNMLVRNPDERLSNLEEGIKQLNALREVPTESPNIRESYLQAARFIEREDELALLETALEQIGDHQVAVWLVGGESGVGKSRLLDELRIRAMVRGVLVVRGQAVDGGGLPFQEWRDITRRLLLTAPVADLHASVLKDIVPDIEDLLGRPVPDAPELKGSAYQRRMVMSIVELLANTRQNLLIILEDLQWSTDGLLPIKQALQIRDQLPHVMVAVTFRNDEAPELPQELDGATVVMLDRLSRQGIAELSTAMLGNAGKDPQVIEVLESQTEGNTFFIVEVVRALAEQAGSLSNVGSTTLPEQIFTQGMRTVLQRRIAQVPTAYQPMVELAAVYGRQVDSDVMQTLVPDLDLQDWLYRCEVAAVLSVSDNQWQFAHDKIRDAILIDVPPERKPLLHRRVAEAIETVYPDQEAFNRMLFEHWKAAGNFDKEMHFLAPVTDRMVGVTDEHLEARELLRNALRQLSPVDQRRIRVLNLLTFSHWRQGNLDRAEEAGHEALRLAEQVGDDDARAESLKNLGMTLSRLGRYEEALQHFDEALDYSVDTDMTGFILNNLGVVHLALGDNDAAIRCYQESLARHQETGNQWAAAMVLNNLGMEYARLRDHEKAYDCLQRSLSIRETIGDQWGLAGCYNNMGLVATWQDKTERAIHFFDEAVAIYRSIGARREVANGLVNRGYIEAKHVDENAIQTLTESITLAYITKSIPIVLEGLACWVWILALGGEIDEAVELTGFVQAHPAYNIEVLEKLEGILPVLKADHSLEALETMKNRGAQQELDDVLKDLINQRPTSVAAGDR
jgi:tetratricopeptide (TPR) repeat protein